MKLISWLLCVQVLDCVTKDGDEFLSDLDDDDELIGAEMGEDEMDEEQEIALLESQLTEEQRQKLKEAGITFQEYISGNGPDGLFPLDDDDDEEDGEDDVEGDDDEDDENAGEKRARQE